jgi:hypothetical protein
MRRRTLQLAPRLHDAKRDDLTIDDIARCGILPDTTIYAASHLIHRGDTITRRA